MSAYQVRYRVLFENGDEIESSGEEVMELSMGEGFFPAKVERAIEACPAGTDILVSVAANEEAFGRHDPRLVHLLPLSSFPPHIDARAGALLEFSIPGEETTAGHVISIANDQATVDFNHPLIGKDLVFDIEVVAVPLTAY